MPEKKINSVRELARVLGISHTTVSDALRDNPRVSPKTRRRVQEAAREFGYQYNPLAGSIMSEIRRSSVGSFRGVVAIVDLESNKQRSPFSKAYHDELLSGAGEAAAKLGYRVDHLVLGNEKISINRLNGILKSRGINGVLFLPVEGRPNLTDFDWEHLTGVYLDYLIDDPAINSVSPDHFRSMTIALQELINLGYRRPGLVLREAHDRRLLFRWEAAFSSYWGHHTDYEVLAPLVTGDLTRDQFIDWFQANDPDVVMCHQPEVLNWMKEIGCQVPQTHGFCSLNLTFSGVQAAGLDLMPRTGGKRGMESLIAQIQRNEYGIPDVPTTGTYTAQWRDGSTLRNQV